MNQPPHIPGWLDLADMVHQSPGVTDPASGSAPHLSILGACRWLGPGEYPNLNIRKALEPAGEDGQTMIVAV